MFSLYRNGLMASDTKSQRENQVLQYWREWEYNGRFKWVGAIYRPA